MSGEPDYEAALGLIKHLPTDELKELVNNDEKITELLRDLPQMKNLVSEQEMLLVANKSLAEYNVSLEPKLSQGKQELIAKYEEAAEVIESVKTIKHSIDSNSSQQSADTVQALLQTAAQETEEETENLVQAFLDKEHAVDDFLTEFLSKRKIAHLRRIKAEKILEIISHGGDSIDQQGSTGMYPPSHPIVGPTGMYPPSHPTVGTTWSAPYPAQINMPMPGYL